MYPVISRYYLILPPFFGHVSAVRTSHAFLGLTTYLHLLLAYD